MADEDERVTSDEKEMEQESNSNGVAEGYLGQSVIPVVNKLQDIFAQLGTKSSIDLPQVAVVGSQSSGKSSVLEALVGRDFLPRGSEICTRRPLVLQLVQTPKSGARKADAEWGEFLHLPGKRFTDFPAIRHEIQAETDRETGGNKGISEKQIRLKIYSPYVLNITLVDLPGITKVPVGDQPSDIEARVRTMILSYIKHDTCIILAVSPANADLANSDALQMARMADPDGSRTIGVITKLDIMDRGTDARNFLLGNVIPLHLGYVGIINRAQEDITKGTTVKEGLSYEEQFFRSRPVYHSLADRCGVPQLAKKLNSILVQHIRVLLPELKARINAQVVTLQKELASYGEMTEKASMGMLLLNILTRYSSAFSTIVDGKNEEMSTSELSGGARIHYIFQAIFVKRLEDVDPCDDLSDDDIRTAIQNATGPKNVLFIPEVPFEVLIRRQIARLLDPSLQCARFVYDELVKISHGCEGYEVQRFPVLRRRIEETVSVFLRDGLAPAETMIAHLINMEMDYINTSHPNFIGGSKAVEMALAQGRTIRSVDNSSDWKESAVDKVADKPKTRTILSRNNLPIAPYAPETGLKSAVQASTASSHGDTHRGSHAGGATSWGISSIFSASERGTGGKGSMVASLYADTLPPDHAPVSIHLRESVDNSSDWKESAVDKVADKPKTRTILSRNNLPIAPYAPETGLKSAVQASTASSHGDTHRGSHAGGATSWGISSIFSASERGTGGKGSMVASLYADTLPPDHAPVSIHLREPPAVLRPSEEKSAEDCTEIAVTRLLLKSYYDIVRKNIQDAVPKAIMHFLVNQVKRELHNVFIRELYRESSFEEMLQEREEVALKRQRCKEVLRVLQHAARTLEELPLESEGPPRTIPSGLDATGLPSSSHNLGSSLHHFEDSSQLPPNPYSTSPYHSRATRRGGGEGLGSIANGR